MAAAEEKVGIINMMRHAEKDDTFFLKIKRSAAAPFFSSHEATRAAAKEGSFIHRQDARSQKGKWQLYT